MPDGVGVACPFHPSATPRRPTANRVLLDTAVLPYCFLSPNHRLSNSGRRACGVVTSIAWEPPKTRTPHLALGAGGACVTAPGPVDERTRYGVCPPSAPAPTFCRPCSLPFLPVRPLKPRGLRDSISIAYDGTSSHAARRSRPLVRPVGHTSPPRTRAAVGATGAAQLANRRASSPCRRVPSCRGVVSAVIVVVIAGVVSFVV